MESKEARLGTDCSQEISPVIQCIQMLGPLLFSLDRIVSLFSDIGYCRQEFDPQNIESANTER